MLKILDGWKIENKFRERSWAKASRVAMTQWQVVHLPCVLRYSSIVVGIEGLSRMVYLEE